MRYFDITMHPQSTLLASPPLLSLGAARLSTAELISASSRSSTSLFRLLRLLALTEVMLGNPFFLVPTGASGSDIADGSADGGSGLSGAFFRLGDKSEIGEVGKTAE